MTLHTLLLLVFAFLCCGLAIFFFVRAVMLWDRREVLLTAADVVCGVVSAMLVLTVVSW